MKDSLQFISDSLFVASDTLSDSQQPISLNLFGSQVAVNPKSDLSQLLGEAFTPDWLSLIFLGTLIYFILIKFILNIHLMDGLKGLFKIEVLDEVGFEKTNRILALFLAPFGIIVYAWYSFFILNPFYITLELDYLFLLFSIFFALSFVFKKLVEYLIAVVFNTQKAFKAYLMDHLFLLGVSSVLQLIFIVFYTYSQEAIFLWSAYAVLIIFFIYRLTRSFIIGFRLTAFYKSYLFLYLCSLEILPIIWIIKWVTNYS